MNITVTHWEQNTLSHFLFYSLQTVYLTSCRTIREVQYGHTFICVHTLCSANSDGGWFTTVPQSRSCTAKKINKKLVMHTLTFLFPDSLAERTSCGSWLHNHANTTHLEPNQVSLSQTTHTLNSCTMHFAKTIHPNVIPGQQQLTNTLITSHEMWASHIHNIPLPQHDASVEIKTKTESS